MSWLNEKIQFTRVEILGLLGIISMGFLGVIVQYIPEAEPKQYDLRLSDIMINKEATTENDLTFEQSKNKKHQPNKSSDFNDKSHLETKFKKKTESKNEIFNFDPNNISIDSLQLLGFKNYQAKRWIKFRNAGKKFNELDDVLSIYGIDTNLVLKLDKQIQFPKLKQYASTNEEPQKDLSLSKEKTVAFTEKKYKVELEANLDPIDINICTEADLKSIKGIGPKYASRIIKYRSILGGYSNLDQLLEVYGMTDSTYWLIEKQLKIETPPEQLRINTASQDQLADHYLISYKMAKLIFVYREEHGPFVDPADFRALKGIENGKINKILPYLDFAL